MTIEVPAEPEAPPRASRGLLDRRTLITDAVVAAVTLVVLALPSLMLFVALGAVELQWPFGIVVTLAICGAILVRRSHPVAALAALTGLAAVHVTLGAPLYPVWFGVLVVLYSVGRFARWRGRLGAFGLALVASLLAAYWITVPGGLGAAPGTEPTLDELVRYVSSLWVPPMLLFSMTILVGWGVGATLRSQAATATARVSERRADQEEERAALARDMHDVVAHSLAVVIAQANGARYTADPAVKDASLETIAGTAKHALGDVRLLLTQLRHSEAPDPVASLDGLDALVERMRAAGLDVRLTRAGGPAALPRTADIAAYRILQEALTNALRHGDRTQPVHVRLHGGETLVLDVHNRLVAEPDDAGHGVRGMHERASLAGGALWTGIDDGWFRVRAVFPCAPVVTGATRTGLTHTGPTSPEPTSTEPTSPEPPSPEPPTPEPPRTGTPASGAVAA